MKATGLGLPMRALVGLNLTTTASNFLMDTGMEIAAGWNTITAGTTTATATRIAIEATTITTIITMTITKSA